MSIKTYSVGVETINDENPTATEIKFNNEIIWKRGVNPPLRVSLIMIMRRIYLRLTLK